MEPMDDDPDHGVPMNVCQSDPHNADISSKDLIGLSDLYWVHLFLIPSRYYCLI